VASFFEMPAISPTMEFGTLVAWKVKEGDAFGPGTVIAEVATDKANMDAEIFDSGIILKLLAQVDDEIPPGFPMLIIGKTKDEDISGLIAEFEARKAAKAAAPAAPVAAPVPSPAPVVAPEPVAAPAPRAPAPATEVAAASLDREWMGKKLPKGWFYEPLGDRGFGRVQARILATPLARKVAEEKGIDLRRVRGSGPNGRIVREDVESARPTGGRGPVTRPADEALKISPMRKTIARRLSQSHTEIPVFYLTAEIVADNLVSFRESLKVALPDAKISYNDIVIAAVGRALRAYPQANASWGEKTITRHGRVDVGMAVALPDGLITPVVRDADQKPIDQIALETRDLATRAKDGKLAETEYTGGTFTVSNLGMMGIRQFTAIINPPESAILAVGSLDQRPIVKDGALAVGWRMDITLSADHRVMDGAVGAGFLQVLRRFLEHPVLIALS
jgi:pyruvate dehydrogenase E2 component (dihydrolipoamide acetyltransferase)